jgi:hypothetical protein
MAGKGSFALAFEGSCKGAVCGSRVACARRLCIYMTFAFAARCCCVAAQRAASVMGTNGNRVKGFTCCPVCETNGRSVYYYAYPPTNPPLPAGTSSVRTVTLPRCALKTSPNARQQTFPFHPLITQSCAPLLPSVACSASAAMRPALSSSARRTAPGFAGSASLRCSRRSVVLPTVTPLVSIQLSLPAGGAPHYSAQQSLPPRPKRRHRRVGRQRLHRPRARHHQVERRTRLRAAFVPAQH